MLKILMLAVGPVVMTIVLIFVIVAMSSRPKVSFKKTAQLDFPDEGELVDVYEYSSPHLNCLISIHAYATNRSSISQLSCSK